MSSAIDSHRPLRLQPSRTRSRRSRAPVPNASSNRRRTSSRSIPIDRSRVSFDPQPMERPPCHARRFTEEAQEDVFRPDVAVAQIPRLLLGVDHRPPSRLREPFEHRVYFPRPRNRRPACFLCTACLLTCSSAAISCHDQSKLLAFWTWIASSCSTSRRRVTTARSPTRGSLLLAWFAILVVSVMGRQYMLTPACCQPLLTALDPGLRDEGDPRLRR